MTHKERQKLIESYGQAHAAVVNALKEFPREMWQYKPATNKWSVHEIIVHLAESEANSFIRCRVFLAEPGRTLFAYDQDTWAIKCDYHQQSPETALETFRWLRQSSYELIKMLPEESWNAKVMHPEHGEMTFDTWLKIYENHTPKHIGQMRRNLEAWRSQ